MTKEQVPQIPDFISKSFIEKSLQNGLNCKEITVNDLNVTMGSSAGDNYCSEIYRAKVKFTQRAEAKEISLIIKAMPFMEHRGPAMEELEVFDKEVKMYTETLPRMSQLINNEFLAAKCFYATREPVQLIVFEDLKEKGFVMADRNKGLDEAHCKLTLHKLGKLHAASVALARSDAKAMDLYKFGMIKPGISNPLVTAVFEGGCQALANVSETWTGFKPITEKLNVLKRNFIKRLEKATVEALATAQYKVLNHGDFWVNNIMFRYDEGKPVEVVFLDYQMSYFASPGIDLNYFIHTSPQNQIREDKLNSLIDTYYSTFANTLADSNSKSIPTLIELKNEIKRCEYYGLFAAVGVLPIVVLDKSASENSNLENMGDGEQGEQLRRAMYTNGIYVEAVQPILKRLNDSGIIDHLNEFCFA